MQLYFRCALRSSSRKRGSPATLQDITTIETRDTEKSDQRAGTMDGKDQPMAEQHVSS